MNDSIPVFSKDNLLYFRDEKEGYMTLISKEHPETMELIINPTSKEILELCDGKRTISNIYKTFEEWYPKVSKQRLQLDINKTFSTYSRLGIIKWKGGNPFIDEMREKIGGDLSISVGYEEHLPIIMDFLNSFGIPTQEYNIPDDYYFYLNPILLPNQEYKDVVIRQKLFSFSEELFLLREKDELSGLVTIGVPIIQKGKSKAGVINLIIIKKEDIIFKSLIKYALMIFPIFSIVEPTKINFLSEKEDEDIISHLKENGFVSEETRKNEIGFNKDINLYSYYYSEKFIDYLKAKTKIKI